MSGVGTHSPPEVSADGAVALSSVPRADSRLALLSKLRGLRPEVLFVAPFAALFLACLSVGLPLSLPNGHGLAFVERHYFRPLLVAAVIQGISLLWRRKRQHEPGRLQSIAVLGGVVALTILLHFNFKAWMPLVNPGRFDLELELTDGVFGNLVPALIGVRRAIAAFASSTLHFNVDSLYHGLFVAIFFVSFSAHALFDSTLGLRRVVTGACLVLLLGGVAYWVMPAKGPFIYRPVVENQMAQASQYWMSRWFDSFVETRQLPPGYFAAPLAAMPSLHTAHSVLFLMYGWRRVRWLGWLFVPCLLWILIEAVATGWHYVLDLGAGALLAWLCVFLVDKSLPEPARGSGANGAGAPA